MIESDFEGGAVLFLQGSAQGPAEGEGLFGVGVGGFAEVGFAFEFKADVVGFGLDAGADAFEGVHLSTM